MRNVRTTLIATIAIGLMAVCAAGVAGQDEPVEVTGGMTWGEADGHVETWTMSDPRLSGVGQWDPRHLIEGPRGFEAFTNGRTIETDGGTWRAVPTLMASFPGSGDDDTWDLLLVGEDGHEGLVFIGKATYVEGGIDVHGYIIDTAAS